MSRPPSRSRSQSDERWLYAADSALLTDFYELTMMQGYFLHQHNPPVVCDLFFRRLPFAGGFAVSAGLEDALRSLERLRFSEHDLEFLSRQKVFRAEFIEHLASFRFSGDIYAAAEGTPVFPNEPILRVHAPLEEAQLVESLLLNIINFQTLIATKAARIYLASGWGTVLEFGLRRAQGVNGAVSAARAAYIGGASATSNTLAGRLFDIPVKGTMGHSWVMSFDTEREAFQRYADFYPAGCLLLIDTYDTLGSGIENAISVGKGLPEENQKGFGIRLDSGDLESLSREVRRRLDEAGLPDGLIAASNELDEYAIRDLVRRDAPIDIWGVGTHLVTANGDPALTGVYKLIARKAGGRWVPAIKVSDDPQKMTNPGVKQIYRCCDGGGSPLLDLLALEDEAVGADGMIPLDDSSEALRSFSHKLCGRPEPLLELRMKEGKILGKLPKLSEIQERSIANLRKLPDGVRRIDDPETYPVVLSRNLMELKSMLRKEHVGPKRF